MLIYCAHYYGGHQNAKDAATRKIRKLQYNDLQNTYVSPIHALGYLYKYVDYDTGMELCYDLLMVCDKLLVLSSPSDGVAREINMAKKLHMPIEYASKDIERECKEWGSQCCASVNQEAEKPQA